MDSDFVKRKLRALQTSYDEFADLAAVHGGPACIETFGEAPFSPVSKEGKLDFYRSTAETAAELDNESSQIVNRYIKGDERKFYHHRLSGTGQGR